MLAARRLVGDDLFAGDIQNAPRVVATLLAVRTSTLSAGNRRPLFAAMDALLSGADLAGDGDVAFDLPTAVGGAAVRLERLRLRNWRSFERADLVLPDGGPDRPVVIVGGANGFGKSSILEAFVLGLFGRRAISDIGFLVQGTSGRAGQRRGYRSILERALHRSTRAIAEGMCSVALDFATAHGPISVERKWYFDEDGRLVEGEEELLVRVGDDRHLLVPIEGVPAKAWYQEELERLIMPADLAPFFVFDGEQVERWAERKLSDQVRSAVAKMLGLDDLRGLAEDLRDYARDRERGTSGNGLVDASQLQAEIEVCEVKIRAEEEALRALEAELADLRRERDEAVGRMASLSAGSHADLQGALEDEHRLLAERSRLERELAAAIVEHGPLLLAGANLRARVGAALERGLATPAAELDGGTVDALWQRFVSVEPPLSPDETDPLRDRFFAALLSEGTSSAEDDHRHLDRARRHAARSRLAATTGEARSRLEEAARSLRDTASALDRSRLAALDRGRLSAERIALQARLGDLSRAIEATEGDRGAIRRTLEGLLADLRPLRADLERLSAQLREAEPRLRTAMAARSLASALERHMAAIADGEHQRFGEAVTRCYRALAHKDQIARISIRPDGTVGLFDANDRDVTDYRLSAGEAQLFAMALIAAVGEIVGDRLPLVVDTPLGRLDTMHRESVLAMLSRRGSQTILLTQPEEITARHLERLGSVLAGTASIVHAIDPASGVGVSRFRAGYEPVGEVAVA